MLKVIKRIFLLAALLALSIFSPSTASASHISATFDWHAGDAFLAGLNPSFSPVVSRAKNGDTLEVVGTGTLSVNPDSVTGGGTFVHKDKDGNVIGSGTWTALELVSFRSWGSGAAQGLPPETEGGRAKIKVHLTPSGGGAGFDGTLRIICTLGDFPSSAGEGVELTIRHGPNFKEMVSGATLFVRKP